MKFMSFKNKNKILEIIEILKLFLNVLKDIFDSFKFSQKI